MDSKQFKHLRQTYGILKTKREGLHHLVSKIAENQRIAQAVEAEFRSKIDSLDAVYEAIDMVFEMGNKAVEQSDFDKLFNAVDNLRRDYDNTQTDYANMAKSLRYLQRHPGEKVKQEILTFSHQAGSHLEFDEIITAEIKRIIPDIDSLCLTLKEEIVELIEEAKKIVQIVNEMDSQGDSFSAFKKLVQEVDPIMEQSSNTRRRLQKQVAEIIKDYLILKKAAFEKEYEDAVKTIPLQNHETFAELENLAKDTEQEAEEFNQLAGIEIYENAISRINSLLEM